ncbi:D-sedoheptulose 7-phosphate isomerase [Candidatus Schneideria nysicola]|uniref:D-sedoheptulose 7-phosphate isomerase n=1 Tax=Candidatus Schneideria nysicola TaxID=1081631 RepID=UPI001CAA7FC6|nr:D-sedoheptulose 7-phosphate isomerase [Candidatus Schneideria nysicola]UAJ65178.1 D-sedoheptulose 7-phosphate isomerase [Candidatus Schneideria nysicola]
MYQSLIYNHFNESIQVLKAFLKEIDHLQSIENAAKLISDTFKSEGKLFSCGNGGSHCNAMHLSEELTGRYRKKRSGYPAIAISDPSHISCVGNDFGYDKIFSRYIESLGKKGDILFGISTSGNSSNIIDVIKTARQKKMAVILLTGKDGGKISGSADVEINVPHIGYADRIQEIHMKIIHIIIFLIEMEMLSV